MTAVITDEMVDKTAKAVRKAMRDHDLHMAWELSEAVSRAALATAAPLFAEQFAEMADDLSGSCRGYSYDNGAGASCFDQACTEIAATIRTKGTAS